MTSRFEGETEFRDYLARVKLRRPNTRDSYVSYLNKMADGNGGHVCPGCLSDERSLAEMLDQMILTEKQHNDLRSAARAYISCFKREGILA